MIGALTFMLLAAPPRARPINLWPAPPPPPPAYLAPAPAPPPAPARVPRPM